MQKFSWLCLLVLSVWLADSTTASGQQKLVVHADAPAAAIEPGMWGVFFEDINLGTDGGLYAELVKNRSFEFHRPLMGWKILGKPVTEGDVMVLNRGNSYVANPRFLRLTMHHNSKGSFGLNNEGFRGMGIKSGVRYDLSFLYRTPSAGTVVYAELIDSAGNRLGTAKTTASFTGAAWQQQTVSFTAGATAMKASLNLWFEGDGQLDLDMISLFPGDTWKNRPGGMRADMVQRLADMRPGFIRFPGGCIVEGFDLAQRYQWKKTLGPAADRQLIINRWNNEFANRPAPDYFQTFGLGFYEYFQLAEDIGARPLPILNCGMSCQFNAAESVPLADLEPYVQDALDLVEFANGDTTTKWGKIRSAMGHPGSFHLTLLGIGNENWGPQYVERLKIFTKALKEKYPGLKLVNSSGTDPDGERFNYLNSELRSMHADLIDEHYYRRPEWFFSNAGRYDNYPRNGSKVFCGEYAAQSDHTVSTANRNNWLTALSEAAFMTGLERNADVVSLASYAPLFAHIDGWQWTPDLIWVNNLATYATPDYYVQQLFSLNQGTRVLPLTADHQPLEGGPDSLYGVASVNEKTGEIIIKLVNASAKPKTGSIELLGVNKISKTMAVTTLHSDDPASENSFAMPEKVSPVSTTMPITGKTISYQCAPYSFSILRIKTG